MPPIPNDDGLNLLARLATPGDPTASLDFTLAYLEPLVAYLERSFPAAEPTACRDVAVDTVMALILNPDAYDPGGCSVWGYLQMVARGDLRNLHARACRRKNREKSLPAVVDQAPARNRGGEHDVSEQLAATEELAAWRGKLAATLPTLSVEERACLDLMTDGERAYGPYAAVLGLAGQPPDVQQREVKRVKDRIRKRAQRGGA